MFGMGETKEVKRGKRSTGSLQVMGKATPKSLASFISWETLCYTLSHVLARHQRIRFKIYLIFDLWYPIDGKNKIPKDQATAFAAYIRSS
jgi:hypothetical protein